MKQQSKKTFLVLPFASTAVPGEPALCTAGGDLLLRMDYDHEGEKRSAGVRFMQHRAHRMRSECYCTRWHIEMPYDALCEIEDSKWVDELRADAPKEWQNYWVMRHFMIYVEDFGCLEVVAESAVLNYRA